MKKRDLEAIASLHQWGVEFLSSAETCDMPHPLDPPELIARLIQSDAPRLKLGVVAFFLVLPHKSSAALDSLSFLNEEASQLLKYYYTAAVYLQRLWKSQLAPQGTALLPDYFSKELKLPSPTLLHGKLGLVALEEALQKIMHAPYNYLSSFEALVRVLTKEVSPADFIPLPVGWQERSPYVGRFGGIDVYHFDLYSTALSKIDRGTEVDFDDVKALLKGGKIEWKELQEFYEEILPHFGQKSLKQDPARIQRNFKILESLKK